ncbi:MAG: hypothetical protein Q8Q29_08455 [Actinomycetota bacterium]|nr:hypothetical protein [Actinomycetota bacterium]
MLKIRATFTTEDGEVLESGMIEIDDEKLKPGYRTGRALLDVRDWAGELCLDAIGIVVTRKRRAAR